MMDSERVRESMKTCNCFTVSQTNKQTNKPEMNEFESHFLLTFQFTITIHKILYILASTIYALPKYNNKY